MDGGGESWIVLFFLSTVQQPSIFRFVFQHMPTQHTMFKEIENILSVSIQL